MSKRIRHRHQRKRLYYRVIRPDGTEAVVSATQFIANVAAGNLIRDSNDMRLARIRKRLRFRIDRETGELKFEAQRKRAPIRRVPTSTDLLLRSSPFALCR